MDKSGKESVAHLGRQHQVLGYRLCHNHRIACESSVQWGDVAACCLDVVPDLLGAWLDCGCCAQQS